MSNAATYEKAYAKYTDAAIRAKTGDKSAHAEKGRIMQDLRAIKRDAARSGVVLNVKKVQHVSKGDKSEAQVQVETSETDNKRSLQEEYVRRFSDKTPVKIGDEVTDLRSHHRRRLLTRA